MSVPEATVHKDDGTVLPQHDIGCTGQGFHPHSVAKSLPPQPPSHNHLGARVPATNAAHAVMPLFWCHLVHCCFAGSILQKYRKNMLPENFPQKILNFELPIV